MRIGIRPGMEVLSLYLLVMLAVFLPGAAKAGSPVRAGEEPGQSYITYTLADQTVHRLAAREGAEPEDISAALDILSPRQADEWLNVSPDGEWLLISTERFDPECLGWACLALVPADLSAAEVLRIQGGVVRAEGFSAVASGGDLVVFTGPDGPHQLDLFALRRVEGVWTGPFLLTADSPDEYNEFPAISDDGTKIVFHSGSEPYNVEGARIAEVGSDGTGFRIVIGPDQPPPGLAPGGSLRSPDYAPDGSIVFEGDWNGERVWRLEPGQTTPTLVNESFGNDNSPAVLPDGRIVSLWLGRPEGQGFHEIKVMTLDGSAHYLALTEVDVADIGIGCGGLP